VALKLTIMRPRRRSSAVKAAKRISDLFNAKDETTDEEALTSSVADRPDHKKLTKSVPKRKRKTNVSPDSSVHESDIESIATDCSSTDVADFSFSDENFDSDQTSDDEHSRPSNSPKRKGPRFLQLSCAEDPGKTDQSFLPGLIKSALLSGQLRSIGAQTDLSILPESIPSPTFFKEEPAKPLESALHCASANHQPSTLSEATCTNCGNPMNDPSQACDELVTPGARNYENPCSNDDLSCEVQ